LLLFVGSDISVDSGSDLPKKQKRRKQSIKKSSTVPSTDVSKNSSDPVESLGSSISRYQLQKKENPECVFGTKSTHDNTKSLSNGSAELKSIHEQTKCAEYDAQETKVKQNCPEEVKSANIPLPVSEKIQEKCAGEIRQSICANWKAGNNGHSSSATFSFPYQMAEIHTSATVVANRTDNANSTILQCTVVLENTPHASS